MNIICQAIILKGFFTNYIENNVKTPVINAPPASFEKTFYSDVRVLSLQAGGFPLAASQKHSNWEQKKSKFSALSPADMTNDLRSRKR